MIYHDISTSVGFPKNICKEKKDIFFTVYLTQTVVPFCIFWVYGQGMPHVA
jgi:hypothetical protein